MSKNTSWSTSTHENASIVQTVRLVLGKQEPMLATRCQEAHQYCQKWKGKMDRRSDSRNFKIAESCHSISYRAVRYRIVPCRIVPCRIVPCRIVGHWYTHTHTLSHTDRKMRSLSIKNVNKLKRPTMRPLSRACGFVSISERSGLCELLCNSTSAWKSMQIWCDGYAAW